MKCNACGAEIDENAQRCPICGVSAEPLTETMSEKEYDFFSNQSSSFSMPYLSTEMKAKSSGASEEDPKRVAERALIRRSKLIRRFVALGVVVALAAGIVLYVVLMGGYKKALHRYVKGMDKQKGSAYTAIVPSEYLDYQMDAYGYNRREIKENMSDYFTYMMARYEEVYGENVKISYDVLGTSEIKDNDRLAEYEENLKEAYGLNLSVSEAVSVRTKLCYEGDTQSEYYTESLVFLKIGMKWYSLDAMEQMEFVAENDGYGLW